MFRKLINWILIIRLKRKLRPYQQKLDEIPNYSLTQEDMEAIYSAFPNHLLRGVQQSTLPKRKIFYPDTLLQQLDVLEKMRRSAAANSTISMAFVQEKVLDRVREQLLTTVLRGQEPATLLAQTHQMFCDIDRAILKTPEAKHHHFRSRVSVSLALYAELLLSIGDALANPEG